jgi:protein-export chaperone SecB
MMDGGQNRTGSGEGGSLILVSHYLKDQSFRNAGGPSGLPPRRQVDMGCDLVTRRVDAENFEVALKLRVQSADAGTLVFALELTYAGLFRLQDIPANAMQSALLVDAPTLLLGHAREIVDDLIQKGGMPPLKLDAMDFAALYQSDTGNAPVRNITVVRADALPVTQKPEIHQLFATNIYSAPLGAALDSELEAACLKLAAEDEAGRRWSRLGLPKGYTSFSSIDDLPRRAPAFAALVASLDRHIAAFTQAVEFDMQGRRLVLDSIWVNVLQEEGTHPAHIHPQAAVSGTYYVSVPPGGAAIYFEDPRTGLMMAAPPRAGTARLESRSMVTVHPKAGNLLLWESWLRHGVEFHGDRSPRISISFNYKAEALEKNKLAGG